MLEVNYIAAYRTQPVVSRDNQGAKAATIRMRTGSRRRHDWRRAFAGSRGLKGWAAGPVVRAQSRPKPRGGINFRRFSRLGRCGCSPLMWPAGGRRLQRLDRPPDPRPSDRPSSSPRSSIRSGPLRRLKLGVLGSSPDIKVGNPRLQRRPVDASYRRTPSCGSRAGSDAGSAMAEIRSRWNGSGWSMTPPLCARFRSISGHLIRPLSTPRRSGWCSEAGPR